MEALKHSPAIMVEVPLTAWPAPQPASASLTALCMIARLHQVAADPLLVAHQLGWPPTSTHLSANPRHIWRGWQDSNPRPLGS